LAVKYSKLPRFSKMAPAEIFIEAQRLMLKIHVITGWVIPDDPLMGILIDQFSKKMTEDYGNMNADEVELAFRKNSGHKDWGKSMNLALIDEVLSQYLAARVSISRMEEYANKSPQKAIADIPMTDAELLTATFETYKLVPNYNFIPVSVYANLVINHPEFVTKERKKAIFLQVQKANPDMDYYEGIDLCKKRVVAEYFNNCITENKQP
jgi:hypothetical protein